MMPRNIDKLLNSRDFPQCLCAKIHIAHHYWPRLTTGGAARRTFFMRISGKFSSRAAALCVGLALAGGLLASPAMAQSTWDGLKPDVFGDRPIADGRGMMEFSAPMRPADQSNVPLAVKARLADGRTIKSVSFIVDENPSPVAAVFELGEGRSDVSIAAKFRLNEATDVRAVVEASDGQLYMIERHVKFAGGQASCSAPPAGDPAEIAANMGRMTFEQKSASMSEASSLISQAHLQVSHPNHTGMVLDQITLLYVPLRIVTDIEVNQGGDRVFAMKGSMTLSQDPAIDFDFRRNGASKLDVVMRDSDGASWKETFPLGHGS